MMAPVTMGQNQQGVSDGGNMCYNNGNMNVLPAGYMAATFMGAHPGCAVQFVPMDHPLLGIVVKNSCMQGGVGAVMPGAVVPGPFVAGPVQMQGMMPEIAR
mmetsp:Transcript_70120/g.146689  ORF Transcript_70120/g.146689 Transcript_70120/m.146689 type:complete len:101 (-) Transcript_70120:59-361(-)